ELGVSDEERPTVTRMDREQTKGSCLTNVPKLLDGHSPDHTRGADSSQPGLIRTRRATYNRNVTRMPPDLAASRLTGRAADPKDGQDGAAAVRDRVWHASEMTPCRH